MNVSWPVALLIVLGCGLILILAGLALYIVEYSIVTFFLRCCGIGVRRNREPEFYAIVDPSLQTDTDGNGHINGNINGLRFSSSDHHQHHQVIIMTPTPHAAYLVPFRHIQRPILGPVPALEGFKVLPDKANNPCGICLEPFEKDIVSAGTCMHIFHKKCISSWLAKDASQSCPLCRNTFLSANSHSHSVRHDSNSNSTNDLETRAHERHVHNLENGQHQQHVHVASPSDSATTSDS